MPENDPTTLFTSSGMQPLVPYLLGEEHPQGVRLVNSQRAFRAQDINEVGEFKDNLARAVGQDNRGNDKRLISEVEVKNIANKILTLNFFGFGIPKQLIITFFKGATPKTR